jgi:hypothetical protein
MGLKATIAILRDRAEELIHSEEHARFPPDYGGEHESRSRPASTAHAKDAAGEAERAPKRREGVTIRNWEAVRIERLLADRSIGRRKRAARFEALLDLWDTHWEAILRATFGRARRTRRIAGALSYAMRAQAYPFVWRAYIRRLHQAATGRDRELRMAALRILILLQRADRPSQGYKRRP